MKLVIAFVHVADADLCAVALTEAGFFCTRVPSSGGFLERDNVILLIGVDASRLDGVLDIVRTRASHRTEPLPARPAGPSGEVEVAGATIFVVDVDRFERV